jgi:mannosyltransferase OCH1-like enzyme
MKYKLKIAVLILLGLISVFYFIKPKEKKPKLKATTYEGLALSERDFEALMGKGTSCWTYVQTPEDVGNLHFFKDLYEKNIDLSVGGLPHVKIPKTLHFIWLGPEDFPEESIKNIVSWMQKHPDWTFKFWTDIDRPVPLKGMKKELVSNFNFQHSGDCFYQSENYGEKSQVLRYEILFQEGGLYADHDTLPTTSLNPIHDHYDFYCGLETLRPSILSSSIFPSNHLMAARPQHPILLSCMNWLLKNWDRVEAEYSGLDEDAIINRISHRTLAAFFAGIKDSICQNENRDIVFPSFYFNSADAKRAAYAVHEHKGSWHKKNSTLEKKIHYYLNEIAKKNEKVLLIITIIIALNVLGCAFFFFGIRSIKKRINEKQNS